MNINGAQKIGRNKYFKNKNCYKLSAIIDAYKNPLFVSVNPGNNNDSKIGISDIINISSVVNKLNTRIKPYMHYVVQIKDMIRMIFVKNVTNMDIIQ
jgi:hypothetical protein